MVQNSLYNYNVSNAFMNNICTQYCTDSKVTGIIHKIILNLAINQLTHIQNSYIKNKLTNIERQMKAKGYFYCNESKNSCTMEKSVNQFTYLKIQCEFQYFIFCSTFQPFILLLTHFVVVKSQSGFFAEGLYCQTIFCISQYTLDFNLLFADFSYFRFVNYSKLSFKDCWFQQAELFMWPSSELLLTT